MYRLVSILVSLVALNNYTEQMILRRPRKGCEKGKGASSFSGNIHRAFGGNLSLANAANAKFVEERFKRTERSNTGYMLYHIEQL